MTPNWKYRSWQRGLAISLAFLGGSLVQGNYFANSALAQSAITADETLGFEGSYIDKTKPKLFNDPDDLIDVVKGGATRGNNLFHSFKEFSINEGRQAYFLSPSSDIQNILVRVTGSNPSKILGILGTYQLSNGTLATSNANLFLINPNGIVFGSKAHLDIGGSFVGSTASAIKFKDGTFFNTTSLGAKPLLTVSIPIGLQIGRTVGEIKTQKNFLAVQPGKTLALVGGNIILDNAFLQAESGQIALGGILGEGIIELNIDSNERTLSFPNDVTLADISLSNGAIVNVSEYQDEDTVNDKGGGYIQLEGRNITLTNGSQVFADNQWSQNGRGISVQAKQLTLRDGSQISAATYRSGNGGSLTVRATDSVQVIGTDASNNPSDLLTTTFGDGTAGNLTIETGKLIVADGGNVAASAEKGSEGRGGILKVTALDFIKLSGTSLVGDPSGLFAQALGNGDAGFVTIDTKQLIAQDGAQVVSGTGDKSQGNGGVLTVFASDFVELSGKASNTENTSGLFARSRGTGNAGSISISTRQLIIRDQAQVTVSSIMPGAGTAGSLIVDANSIYLNNAAKITADTTGGGGDIFLRSPLLLLRNQSSITTNAKGSGIPGGNIKIDALDGFIIAVPEDNSDISANSVDFRGGKVQISAQGIFGIQRRNTPTPKSDITATGASPEFSGSVELNTPGVDPNSGLVELPTIGVETEVAQVCDSPSYAQSSFIITGSGGLPPNPTKDILPNDAVNVGWVSLKPSGEASGREGLSATRYANANDGLRRSSNPPAVTKTVTTPEPIVEANGWVINKKGEVVLTANVPSGSRGSWQKDVPCSVTHAHQ
ncbi:filamentous hemagglutinin N-terminal domain-containing protein [Nostoc sp. PA-18-2419]|uniref:two-partner secretion domain-containing protein n=1 Tax=Nostoc sp. PA-18-2419 TaxID=2575443 RepID=UPI0011086D88|nr:filamentous hemagglutinin N-terminal domain-containing protein [Nostoc sp. PA-18-2419]